MTKRILVMGLPGSGKTTFSAELSAKLIDLGYVVGWFNADEVRKLFDDWDFSENGRLRQSWRMRDLADDSKFDYAICDFVAPLPKMREIFAADYTVWLDTIGQGRFDDTNRMFIPPELFTMRITTQDCVTWVDRFLNSYITKNG